MSTTFILALAAAALSPAAEPTAAREATIAFPERSIRSFHAADDETVYLRGPGRRWYKATLLAPCRELPFALAIGYDTRGGSAFDRFSTLVVEGEHCPIQSLVESEAPPKKVRKRA